MMTQRSVKNRSTADPALPVHTSDSTTTKNTKRAERLFIPDAVAIATDSKLSNLALTLVLGVSPQKRSLTILFVLLMLFFCRSCSVSALCKVVFFVYASAFLCVFIISRIILCFSRNVLPTILHLFVLYSRH